MLHSTPLANVVDTIRLAVAPVFLLTGVGALLGVMTGRLSRVVDRAHVLNAMAKTSNELDANQRAEVRIIPRRLKLIKGAILTSVASALLVCLVIALLFVSSLVDLPIATAVAFVFIASMVLMMSGLLALLAEVYLTLRLFHVFSVETVNTGAS
jgi:predicted phage tail protein